MSTKNVRLNSWGAMLTAGLILLAGAANAQSIAGNVKNQSTWQDNVVGDTPPGDGDTNGVLRVGIWSSSGDISGAPFVNINLATGTMPFTYNSTYIYSFAAIPNGTYQVLAWVDADNDGEYDLGEPRSTQGSIAYNGTAILGYNLTVRDDSDSDSLPDWWEAHWFTNSLNSLSYDSASDPDKDGLTNLQEYQYSSSNPADWDTDKDLLDDGYESKYLIDAATASGWLDPDGDGLSNLQEYFGVDGIPPLEFDVIVDGVLVAKKNASTDALNPVDIDTDFDLLIDSYETAWFDPANGIDPVSGPLSSIPTNGIYDTSIAMADSDADGLSNYREQCLQVTMHEGATNEHMWKWFSGPLPVPFAFNTYVAVDGKTVRSCHMVSALNLGAGAGNALIAIPSIRFLLRDPANGWTDPTDGTGYTYVSENIPSGHDSDNDGLPDGYEVEFGLDPRDSTGTEGSFGDPDGDGLLNFEEYLGQDGNRSSTKPYVNGTGDETNPNNAYARPDSTYTWRWLITNALVTPITDPRNGSGINRAETLGGALPTAVLFGQAGLDTDDDGIADADEMNPASAAPSSPVHSTDPFIMRSALITNSVGILIPDIEPDAATNGMPAGTRRDLQRRDWTVEALIKLGTTGMSGDIFRFDTHIGTPRVVYSLSLSNNAPVLSTHINSSFQTVTGNALPTNRWIHLAGVWDHANNNLALYIDGVLFVGKSAFGESISAQMFPATNTLAIGASADGSFAGNLWLDEVRIWGIARPQQLVSKYAFSLLPQSNGDDVWISSTLGGLFYRTNDTVLVNGGSLFEGETGTALTNVFVLGGNYWVDNGNGIYQSASDLLIRRGSQQLAEGSIGSSVSGVLFNDRDGSGGYTRDSLLAYYRFDDGGNTSEDFSRKIKNGLIGATSENHLFGDFGYALVAGMNYTVETNGAAVVYGTHARASDDTDGDRLPDAWELVYQLDWLDNGTGLESAPALMDGPYGALADLDGDGLNNINEFWAGTNPREADSDGDSIADAQEDADADGVSNITEQQLGSRPDLVDTDDDGLVDSVEQTNGTSPVDANDPPVARGAALGGGDNDFLTIPLNFNQRLTSWTVEGLVNPSSVTGGPGTLLRRTVQNIGVATNAVNYTLGLEEDGIGGLRAVAGFIQPGGQQSIIRGGTISTGAFTHLAVTYNNASATMVLYVGGVAVITSNGFTLSPPVNGKGGETFVRMGEGIEGQIDEIRLWDHARSAIQISSNALQTVSPTTPGLIHYFRFDDGQADTNSLPFGPNHQPGGAQDYTYNNDWNDQWRHAAAFNGSVASVGPGAIIPPATLRIILSPDEALALGAQWSLNGGPFNDSGVTLDISTGTHSIIYRSITGWTSPTNETLVITNPVATTLNRTYLQNGALKVNIEPAAVLTASGALFRVDGGPFSSSGTIISNLAPGSHTLEFTHVSGWLEPVTENIIIASSSTSILTRTYTPAYGHLLIVLDPTNAVAQGAQWRVNGGSWNDSGTLLSLQEGSYTAEYRDIAGWIQPSNELVTVQYNFTNILARIYEVDNSLTDVDGDGLPDAWEITYFGNLSQNASGDSDGDGLTNLQEYQCGTDPTNPDTDGDGFSDGIEIARGSDPLNPLSIPAKTIVNDFNGDGATDLTLFWGTTGNWYIRDLITPTNITRNWGFSGVQPLPGDYDGDKKTDLCVRDPKTGFWYIRNSSNNTTRIIRWTFSKDTLVPAPLDYNGDNITDPCLYRPSVGIWSILNSTLGSNSNTTVGASFQWGWSSAKAAPGDYDGDGRTDLTVFYPAGGQWYVRSSISGKLLNNQPIQWGWKNTIPVPGDYDGDRISDIAVFSPTNSTWYIRSSITTNALAGTPIQWGFSGVIPVPGDYDNDGKTDIAVYQPTTRRWYIRQSSTGTILNPPYITFGPPTSAALPPRLPFQ